MSNPILPQDEGGNILELFDRLMFFRRTSYRSKSMKPGYNVIKILYLVTKENLATQAVRAYILDEAFVDSGEQLTVTGRFR